MKITLINPYDFSGPGIRSIASVLRANGHQVESLFLLLDTRVLIHSPGQFRCDQKVLDEILDVCRDSDLVGITLMSNGFRVAGDITSHIKKNIKTPVIWGGIHPTISPGECLDYADMVCVGEGETPMLNLAEKMQKNENYLDTEGIWFKRNGAVVKNRIAPLIQNLDNLPTDDYENLGDKVLKGQEIISVDHKIAEDLIGTQLTVFISRGCPYRCSFCCNNVLNDMYRSQKVVRYKSPAIIAREVGGLIAKFKNVNRIFFSDDSFIVKPLEDIKEFSRLYKEHVKLPFSCLLTAPSVTDEKIKCLAKAGMNDVRIGLQTASPNTLKLYNRPIPAESVRKASLIVDKYLKDGQLLSYDIILDNPYETKEDLITTLKFLIRLPRPYSLRLFSLQLYPGTELYKRALSEKGSVGEFRDAYSGSYRSAGGSYLNALFYLMKLIGLKRCPPLVGKILLRREMLFLLDNRPVGALIKALRNLRSFWKYSLKLKIKFLKNETPVIVNKWYTNV